MAHEKNGFTFSVRRWHDFFFHSLSRCICKLYAFAQTTQKIAIESHIERMVWCVDADRSRKKRVEHKTFLSVGFFSLFSKCNQMAMCIEHTPIFAVGAIIKCISWPAAWNRDGLALQQKSSIYFLCLPSKSPLFSLKKIHTAFCSHTLRETMLRTITWKRQKNAKIGFNKKYFAKWAYRYFRFCPVTFFYYLLLNNNCKCSTWRPNRFSANLNITILYKKKIFFAS